MSRCNFDGWSDVIGEVPWCLSMQTTVRHEAELESRMALDRVRFRWIHYPISETKQDVDNLFLQKVDT